MTTATLTAKTIKLSGNTFKCTSQLKYEHFTFNADEKCWEREVNVSDDGSIYYGDKFQGTSESYAHHWKCYAKKELNISFE